MKMQYLISGNSEHVDLDNVNHALITLSDGAVVSMYERDQEPGVLYVWRGNDKDPIKVQGVRA